MVAVVSIIFCAIFNNIGLIDGPKPSLFNFILSVFFLIIWLLNGFWEGRNKSYIFLIFATMFWVLGFFVLLKLLEINSSILFLTVFVFMAPLNGFTYFTDIYGFPLVTLCTLLPLFVTFLGFIMGYRLRKL